MIYDPRIPMRDETEVKPNKCFHKIEPEPGAEIRTSKAAPVPETHWKKSK